MNPYGYVCDLQVHKVTPAQEAMETALLLLLDEKELHQISVKEVCQRANVARSTFYTYYDVIDDCLQAIENRFLHEIIAMTTALENRENLDGIDLSFFEETLGYLKDNQRLLYLFMIKRYNSRFVNRWKDAIKYHLYQQIPSRISDKNQELTLEIIASGTIGAYQYWLKNPYELDSGYVKQLLRRTLEVYIERSASSVQTVFLYTFSKNVVVHRNLIC